MKARPRMLLVLAVAMAAGGARAAAIRAERADEGSFRIVVPGRFETTVSRRGGFATTWFDLAHDPEKKRNLAPAGGGGLVELKVAEPLGATAWCARPADEVELLETGPVRVRVRLAGPLSKFGAGRESHPSARFELLYSLYATGTAAGACTLSLDAPMRVRQVLLVLRSTGAWGPQGREPGRAEVHLAGEAGPRRPARYAGTESAFVLQWTDGPTYFADLLLAAYKGQYDGAQWGTGLLDREYEAGLDLSPRWPGDELPAGTHRIRFLLDAGTGVNSARIAGFHARAYRSPARPALSRGKAHRSDPGDRDGDGFNEEEGCYVFHATPRGVAFTLHGLRTPRMSPAFKVHRWPGPAPEKIAVGGRPRVAGNHFNASARQGVLVLQLLETVQDDVEIVIPAPP